jgi:poly-gamma-glutamate capsule biosynthesis protein CapA/YwtB (metallophosphatase superfamily)
MSRHEILLLAKQGDHRAIAFFLNEAFSSLGFTVKTTREKEYLYILVESEQLPSQDSCIRVIENGLHRLQPEDITNVTIYGRLIGQQLPSWAKTIELKTPIVSSAPVTKSLPSAKVISSGETKQKPVKKSWLFVGAIGLILLPLSGFLLNAQIKRLRHSPLTPQTPSPSSTISPKGEKVKKLSPTPKSAGAKTSITPKSSSSPKVSTPKTPNAKTPLPSPKASPSNIQKMPSSSPSVSIPKTPHSDKKAMSPSVSIPKTPHSDKKVAIISPTPSANLVATLKIPKIELQPTSDTIISIKAVGDIIPGTNYPYDKLPQDKDSLFSNVKGYLSGADLLFGNYEGTLTDYAYSSKTMGRGLVFAFRTPPSYVKVLKDAGFDILNIANNHSWDFNEQGFKDTINNINNAGMQSIGKKNEIHYETVKGVKVAFIGFSNYGEVHNTLLDIKEGQNLVKKAKENAEIIVISVHAGAEGTGARHVNNANEYFLGENRGNLIAFSHGMIDAGADLILGHGPHVARALELYKGKLIAYSLGNFLGYRTLSTAGELGKTLILEVKMNPKGDFVSGKIIPIELDGNGVPAIDNDFAIVGLIRDLIKSDFPKTPLKIDNQGQILKDNG